MIDGTETYYLPQSNIEVDVTYEIDGEEINFVEASIGDNDLNCDMFGVTYEAKQFYQNESAKRTVSLRTWFQMQLENDAEKIFDRHDVHIRSDYDEHFNQRAFI